MRLLKKVLAGFCMAALVVTMVKPAEIQAASPEIITIKAKDNKVPVFQAGQSQTWTITVTNSTSQPLSQVALAPELGDSGESWPFKTEYQDYKQSVDVIPAGESCDFTFEFVQREDVPSARYTLQFVLTAENEVKASQKFYVNTTAKPEDTKSSQEEGQEADAGGFSNGGVSYSGGGSAGSGSVPRVIVTGFTTDPAEVRAGSNFTLTIHLKNTSKSTRVSNMLFDLSAPTEGSDEQTAAPAFLPASGSSSIYLEGIAANGTADISIQLNAKADLLQKPYSIDMSMKYEDSSATQIEATSSISIPVKQDARFEFSEFEISPESIAVGEEANVMCNLYNLGKIKLYNVKATFEGSCIDKEEVFVGNVESGASASIDAMVEGKKATKGPAKITMTLSYEDEAGEIKTMTKDFQLEVTEASESDLAAMDMEAEDKGGIPVIPILILVAALAVIAAAVIIIRKKKKKQTLVEEEALLDELDGPSEDEQQ
ncbi:COG1361 S-layer family protein [Bariatricus sp. SGI.019]|uniref:COG1361 S-layer family protein n=1 Tax=Bariatricus sp. SGI.019 TaxID=3420548 RepID=UPI003CFFC51B